MKKSLLSILFLLPIAVFAQEMKPPKEVSDLGWMVGTWTGSGKISFGSQSVPITTTMVVSFEGQFLKLVATDKSGGFTMSKTVMIGWDDKKNQYDSYTFTNMAPKPRIAHGKMEGGKLVMVSEPWEAEGMRTNARETLANISDSKLGVMMEFKSSEKWEKGMDFVLTKSK